jgi:hypothetical protein
MRIKKNTDVSRSPRSQRWHVGVPGQWTLRHALTGTTYLWFGSGAAITFHNQMVAPNLPCKEETPRATNKGNQQAELSTSLGKTFLCCSLCKVTSEIWPLAHEQASVVLSFVLAVSCWHQVHCGNITEGFVKCELLGSLLAVYVWHLSRTSSNLHSSRCHLFSLRFM